MSEHEPIRPDETAALFERLGTDQRAACALAVSGGSDSVALMVLFADWLRQDGRDASLHTVMTVDHGLRPESAAEARTVAGEAAALGFKHATLLWDRFKRLTGIQAAARVARYRLMGDYMGANGIALLLTGHTRDDQAETLLMRLARGSGLDGLAGMAPRLHFSDLGIGYASPGDPEIARPLLDVPRARLRATLEARGIAWVEDPGNQSLQFERPRLRAARAQLDALGLTGAMLALSATRLQRARRSLDRAVDRFCSPEAGAVSVDACGYVTINRTRLQAAEEEIVLRVLARAVAAAGGSSEPVPMGKLEPIAAIAQGKVVETAKWTLARAMITADDRTVAVEREPGREPLPQLELQPGTRACWDGRFSVEVAGNATTSAVQVHALGEPAARELHKKGVSATCPVRATGRVPSFWHEGKLVAVPSLGYWPAPQGRDLLRAQFVGNQTIVGSRTRLS